MKNFAAYAWLALAAVLGLGYWAGQLNGWCSKYPMGLTNAAYTCTVILLERPAR